MPATLALSVPKCSSALPIFRRPVVISGDRVSCSQIAGPPNLVRHPKWRTPEPSGADGLAPTNATRALLPHNQSVALRNRKARHVASGFHAIEERAAIAGALLAPKGRAATGARARDCCRSRAARIGRSQRRDIGMAGRAGCGRLPRHAHSCRAVGRSDDCMAQMVRETHERSTPGAALLLLKGVWPLVCHALGRRVAGGRTTAWPG